MSADGDLIRAARAVAAELTASVEDGKISLDELIQQFWDGALQLEKANQERRAYLYGDKVEMPYQWFALGISCSHCASTRFESTEDE